MLESTTFIERKNPCISNSTKRRNWTENTDIELLNLGHFKTKAKAYDESHATFISAGENAPSTPFSNKSLDQKDQILISLHPCYLWI